MAYYARSEGVLGEKQLLHDHLQNVADDRPYLIRGALPPDNKVKITRKYFGLYERTEGADNVRVQAERIHALIQTGSRAPASLTPGPSLIEVQLNLEERQAKAEERLQEDLAALELEEGQPFWWLQVMPKGKAILKEFFENSADSLWQVLVNPPSVRPSGFRLPQGEEPENIDDGLRTTRRSSLSLSVLRSGTMTVIIGPEFLTWAMEPYTHKPTVVNPLSLTEIALNALRLYQTEVIPRTEVHLDKSVWRTGVGHLSAKSILYMPKVFHTGSPYSDSELSIFAADWKLEWRESGLQDPEQLAVVVLGELYAAFHLAENAIPCFRDGKVSIEELQKY